MCVWSCVCEDGHSCHGKHVEVIGQILVWVLVTHPLCLRKGLHVVNSDTGQKSCLEASGYSPVPSFHDAIGALALESHVTISGFNLGSRDLNSGPCVYMANVLPTEPSLQLPRFFVCLFPA